MALVRGLSSLYTHCWVEKKMKIEVVKAQKEDAHVIENLIPLYLHDLSEYMGWRCPENGRFCGQDDLPQYWGKPAPEPKYAWVAGSRGAPFLIRVDQELAGFALVKRVGDSSPPCYEIGGLYILRKFRRKGIGGTGACRLFDRSRGSWTVDVMSDNAPAVAFWGEVVSKYTAGSFSTSLGTCEPPDIALYSYCFSNTEQSTNPSTWRC